MGIFKALEKFHNFTKEHSKWFFIASTALAVILLVIPLFFFRDKEYLKSFGYFGYFVASFLGGSIFVLPFIIHKLNPVVLLFISSTGQVLDEFFSWYAGTLSPKLDTSNKLYGKVEQITKKGKLQALFLIALFPLPRIIYTVSSFAAGHYKISYTNYFIVNFIGKFIRYGIYTIILLRILN